MDTEILIPLSALAKRLENHRDAMRDKRANTPWWKFKKRSALAASAATYEYEIEQLLEWGGMINMKRLVKSNG